VDLREEHEQLVMAAKSAIQCWAGRRWLDALQYWPSLGISKESESEETALKKGSRLHRENILFSGNGYPMPRHLLPGRGHRRLDGHHGMVTFVDESFGITVEDEEVVPITLTR